ncbi:MAG: DUF2971 domain-containing protein [Pseudomonadota bacterium]
MFVGSPFGPVDDPTLYHYTDGAGLLGILKSKSIWASGAVFLNDISEAIQAGRAIENYTQQAELDERCKALIEFGLGYAGFRGTFPVSHRHIDLFVAAFSRGPGNLHLWKSYAGGIGGSYAIGFRSSYLKACGSALGFDLAPVKYEEPAQLELLKPILHKYLATIEQVVPAELNIESNYSQAGLKQFSPEAQDAVKTFAEDVRAVAPQCKDRIFEQEEETRMVLRTGENLNEVEFRASGSGIIPYVPIPLIDPEGNEFHIQNVVVGPSPRASDNAAIVFWAAAKYGVRVQQVNNVGSSLRDW